MFRVAPQWLLLSSLLWVFGACGPREKPNTIYMPEMVYSPAYKAQEEGSMRTPPFGTVPRGFEVYAYTGRPDAAGAALKNPFPHKKEVLVRGQVLFNRFCMPCHGIRGEGDGPVTPKFPRPPTLQSEKVRGWSDGRIFAVITEGQNLMPSYAGQVLKDDRWKIVSYIRVLQRANQPTPEDLEKLKNW